MRKTNKNFLLSLILILVLSSFASATLDTVIYNNTFQTSSDFTRTSYGASSCDIQTSGGFTGLRFKPLATGNCGKTFTAVSTGILRFEYELKVITAEDSAGHDLLGFDDSTTPALDGEVGLQGNTITDFRTQIVGDSRVNLDVTQSNITMIIDFDGNTADIYKDGVAVQESTSYTGPDFEWFGHLQQALSGVAPDYMIKNLFICNVTTTSFSDTCDPVAPPAPVFNESLESTAVVKQSGSVTINTPAFQTIFSSDFNITLNNTNLYGEYTFNVDPSNDNVMFCELLIDSVVVGNITRTNTINVKGAVDFQSPIFSLESGTHDQELRCKRLSGGGNFQINNAVGVGHILVSETFEELNFASAILSGTATNNPAYDVIGGLNITVSNTTLDTEIKTIVVDWAGAYTNNDVSSELLKGYVSINGSDCDTIIRTTDSGGIASVGSSCVLNNVTTNATYEVLFYGAGTNADFDINLIVKEFLHDVGEVKSTEIPSGSFSGSGWTSLVNLTGVNFDHLTANAFIKTSLSFSANQTTEAQFYFNITNGVTVQSITGVRTANTDTGVLVFHDVLEGLSQDNYTLELFGNCGSATCTISSGEVIGYVTDVVTTAPTNIFNVSVFDNYDNSSIGQNFVVTLEDGNFFTSNGDSLLVPTSVNPDNITISVVNNDYFSYTKLNHNTSQNLSIGLNQTLISWDCIEKVSGANLNCTSPTESEVFNYNIAGNPHTQTISVTGYYNNTETFNVTALQSETLNSTPFYSTIQNFTTSVTSGGGTPSVCDFNVTSNDYTFDESVSGTSGTGQINLISGSYDVTVDCDGYAITTETFTVENITQTLDIALYTTNSISITFYDAETLNLINQTITLEIIGFNKSTETTSNGSIYVDLLSPSDYTLIATSTGYRETQYILTMVGRDTFNVDMYLQPTNTSSLVLITVTDKFSNFLSQAEVTVQRYLNNTWVTEQILETDFQGRTEGHFVVSTEFYNFLVEYQGTTFFGNINSDANKKAIFAEDVTNGIIIRIDRGESDAINTYQSTYGIVTSLSFVDTSNTSGYFRFTWDDANNVPRDMELKIMEGLNTNCTDTASSESGSSTSCSVNVTSGTKTYTAIATLDGVVVRTYSVIVGQDETIFIDWGTFGYFLAFVVIILSSILFVQVPSMSVAVAGIAFSFLIGTKMIFSGINLSVIMLILFMVFMVARIHSKSGANT